MPHDDLSKRGFGGTGDSPGMGGKNPYSGTLTDCPITGHARPATAGRADPGPISGPNCSCTSNRIEGPSERPVPIRARSRHAGESGPGDGTRGYEDGAPHCCGAPSAQADQLPSFTTTRRDGLLRLSWVTLTTYLPRLIAVSGYRGLRGELRQGVNGVSLPLRLWPSGGP